MFVLVLRYGFRLYTLQVYDNTVGVYFLDVFAIFGRIHTCKSLRILTGQHAVG